MNNNKNSEISAGVDLNQVLASDQLQAARLDRTIEAASASFKLNLSLMLRQLKVGGDIRFREPDKCADIATVDAEIISLPAELHCP